MRLRWGIMVGAVVVVGAAGWAANRLWLRAFVVRPKVLIPVCERAGGVDTVTLPSRFLVAELSRYDDEFFAYLMYSYLRGIPELAGSEVLLTYSKTENRISYAAQVSMPNNLLSSLPLLWAAKARGAIQQASWRYVTREALDELRYQTHVFRTAYNAPAHRKLEELTRSQLIAYVRRFVRFKSLTDPRIRRGIQPVPQPLTSQAARQLAEDIVTVAEYYSLPLDFFLGIGAMENNYMNVDGDLQNAIWKRRSEKGDIILKRKRGKVLVVNSSSGLWQITRETLRYAHSLYLKDHRDYSLLPARLRPSRELNVNSVDSVTLTTYAGLLFRDLLDRCKGDVRTAVGAYNGGLGKPNEHYSQGVEMVAEYARRTMEHAAVLNGPVAGMRFLSAGP